MMAKRYEVTFHPLAEQEYTDAVLWYENNRTGLGSQFIGEVERVLNNLETNPLLFSKTLKRNA